MHYIFKAVKHNTQRLIGFKVKKNVDSQILKYELNRSLEAQKKIFPQKNPGGIFFPSANTNVYGEITKNA